MTDNARGADAEVRRQVAALAARLNDRVLAVSALVRESLEEHIAELRADARTIELLGASVEGNIETILHALRYDIATTRITAPAAALEYARRLAQQGVPVVALVRAYRLGQRAVTEIVFGEAEAASLPAGLRLGVIESIVSMLSDYIDWISQEVVVVYEEERDRWLENQNSIRILQVRELLSGRKEVDADAAAIGIRYPLRWHHVAIITWLPEDANGEQGLTELQHHVSNLAEHLGCAARPLFVAVDQTSAWVWLPFRGHPINVADRIRAWVALRPNAPACAVGGPSHGLAGFRRSHRQAEAARNVCLANRGSCDRIVAASDPGLMVAALLSADIVSAREWVVDVLGGLATNTENDARLRDTLRLFLRSGSSFKAAALELDLHFNSVKYRVKRAQERRGRPIGDDRLEVELALLVCQWLGAAVLIPAAPARQREQQLVSAGVRGT